MFCKNCGKEIQIDSRFCQHCGLQIDTNLHQDKKNVDSSPLNESQKNVVAKELRIFFRIVGVSLIITVLSIFIIYQANSNNDQFLAYGIDRDALIERNQMRAVQDSTPKVFIYSLILLSLGRYALKGIQWAESRNKSDGGKNEP